MCRVLPLRELGAISELLAQNAPCSGDEAGHRLRLSLDGIDLVLMTREQFDAWLPGTIEGYAKEHVATGRWSKDEAIEKSRQEHEKLLPPGGATPKHYPWFIVRSH